jgi:ubiquinone/menaquinone biosynthesis C-methylase UbiE
MPFLDHFRLIAPFYEMLLGDSHQTDWSMILNLSGGMKILDVGGGTGRIAHFLLKDKCQVFIADESIGMLRQALKKIGIRTVCSMAEALPFPSQHFDRVIMVDAFHHMNNQALAAREMFRVLCIGGILAIQEPDINSFAVKLIALAEKILLMRSHFLDSSQISALFDNLPVVVDLHREDRSFWIHVQRMA